MAKSEHKSSIHPDVPNKPGVTNWVEQHGGLPRYIERVAKHIIADSGYTVSRAIAAAVSQTKKRAAQGNAQAIAAIAQWMRMRAAAKATPNKGSRSMSNQHLSTVELAVPVKGKDGKTRFVDSMAELATVSYSTGPSKQARAEAQKKGQAFKSGRFPIRNLSDAKKAIHAFGRARDEDKPALKRFIIRRLRALGHQELIPKNWTSREMAALHRQVIELAAGTRDRNIYQRHVRNTQQKGKKKGDLKAKADWEHGYIPKTQTAFALKAKHVSKDDLGPSGKPKPGFSREFNLPVPPHLTKSRTDEARSARERSREPGEAPRQERNAETEEKPKQSVAALRRQRSALEKKVAANTATAAERKRLNQIVAEIKRRAKSATANPARS